MWICLKIFFNIDLYVEIGNSLFGIIKISLCDKYISDRINVNVVNLCVLWYIVGCYVDVLLWRDDL